MVVLSTVSPDGSGIVDGKGPGGERGSISSDWEVAGVEPDPGAICLVGQGQARSTERRLGDGVVLHMESELDGVTGSSTDTVRSESEISVGATNNNLNGVPGRRDRGRSRRVGVGRINRCPHIAAEGDGISNERWRRGRGDGGASVVSGPSGRGRLLGISLELLANGKSGFLEVGEGVGGSVRTTVDGADHTTINNRNR